MRASLMAVNNSIACGCEGVRIDKQGDRFSLSLGSCPPGF